MSMSLSQARVVDPVQTEYARGWKHPERVGSVLFPPVYVGVAAGKVLEFGRESFALYNARRAPGAATKRVEFGYEGKPFALVQDSLESKIPREFARDAQAVPGVDLGFRATNQIMQNLTLSLEVDQAALATNRDNYKIANRTLLSGSSQWSDPTSRPADAIADARNAVRRQCGVYPNVAVAGPLVYRYLKRNPSVLGQFRNLDIVTNVALANLLELDVLVEGRAIVADATSGSFSDVWGNYFVLAYAPQKPDGLEQPSFGYTYTMKDNPFVETPYEDRNAKSWVYGGTYERAPVLTGMDAGFLFENVVAVP